MHDDYDQEKVFHDVHHNHAEVEGFEVIIQVDEELFEIFDIHLVKMFLDALDLYRFDHLNRKHENSENLLVGDDMKFFEKKA